MGQIKNIVETNAVLTLGDIHIQFLLCLEFFQIPRWPADTPKLSLIILRNKILENSPLYHPIAWLSSQDALWPWCMSYSLNSESLIYCNQKWKATLSVLGGLNKDLKIKTRLVF